MFSLVRIIIVLGLLLNACSGSTERTDSFAIVDSSGVMLVFNPSVGLLPSNILSDRHEEVRIGVVIGEEPYMFDYIARVGCGPEGRIYALNQGTCTIRVFSPDGVFLYEFGGEGDGPGELRPPLWMYLGSELLITYSRNGSSLFTFSGEFLRRWPRRTVSGMLPSPIGGTAHGMVALVTALNQSSPVVPGGVYQDTMRVVAFDEETGTPGPAVFTYLNARMVAYPRGYGQGELSMYWPFFEPRPQLIVGLDGLMYFNPGLPYRIDVYNGAGKLLKRIHGSHEPIPVTDAIIDDYTVLVRSMYEAMAPRSGWEQEFRRTTEGRRKLGHVDTIPPIGQLLVGRDGALWVERLDLIDDPAQMEKERTFGAGRGEIPMRTRYWDLFHQSGRFLGQVEIPARFVPHAVTLNTVLGVERNSDGVEFIVRYRYSTLEEIERLMPE